MKWWIMVVVLLLGIELGWILIYKNAGVEQYVTSMKEFEKYPDQWQAREDSGLYEEKYSGTVMKVGVGGYGGVWVWGAKGPKYFKADEYSVFSYIGNINGEVEQTVYTDIKIWRDLVKASDHVIVMKANEEHGGNLGRLREVWVYDFWPYLPSGVEE